MGVYDNDGEEMLQSILTTFCNQVNRHKFLVEFVSGEIA